MFLIFGGHLRWKPLCKASSISFHRRSRRREKNGGIFHTEVAKITKGHSNSPAGGAFGLEGRSTRLAGRTEEEFHTEITKIAKGHSNSSVSGAFGLNGRSIRLARQAEERISHRDHKDRKGHSNSPVGGRLAQMDDRFAWHGTPKKNFTQRSLRGNSNSPVAGCLA